MSEYVGFFRYKKSGRVKRIETLGKADLQRWIKIATAHNKTKSTYWMEYTTVAKYKEMFGKR